MNAPTTHRDREVMAAKWTLFQVGKVALERHTDEGVFYDMPDDPEFICGFRSWNDVRADLRAFGRAV